MTENNINDEGLASLLMPTVESRPNSVAVLQTKRAVVIRKPVVMEDEGRFHVVKLYPTKAEAQAWVKSQTVAKDYYGADDYEVYEVEE